MKQEKIITQTKYCDIELCKKLYDDGIDPITNNYWLVSHDFKKIGEIEIGKSEHTRIDPSFKLLPMITHQMAIDYLYEKYKIIIEIKLDTIKEETNISKDDFNETLTGFSFLIWQLTSDKKVNPLYEEFETFNDRYEAINKAIEYCLQK